MKVTFNVDGPKGENEMLTNFQNNDFSIPEQKKLAEAWVILERAMRRNLHKNHPNVNQHDVEIEVININLWED